MEDIEKIVCLKPDDFEQLWTLVQEVLESLAGQGIDQWDAIYPAREDFQADLDRQDLFGLVIENSICGIVTLNHVQDREYGDINWAEQQGKPLIVHRLCVRPSCQGLGLAKKIMGFVIDYARQTGHTSIRLDAFEANPVSMRLYPRLGFVPRGQFPLRKGLFQAFELTL